MVPVTNSGSDHFPGQIDVDLAAIRHNLRTLQQRARGSQLMAVVKADAYGHGRGPVALAAYEAGVRWFGVSQVNEALKLVAELTGAGVRDARVFAWLAAPNQDWEAALSAGLHLSASSTFTLESIAAAAQTLALTAPIHLKVDVGMGRGGARGDDFAHLALVAARLEAEGLITVEGIWSHLPEADDITEAGHETMAGQVARFERALAQAREAGLEPKLRHLAATSGTLWYPETHYDLVRVGIGMYGLSPNPQVAASADLNLRPALSLGAPVILVKRLPAGAGVSYGATWRAERPHWVGLVPLGYADGIPRHGSNSAPVTVQTVDGPFLSQILGRVCMDQVVISLGEGDEPAARVGDWAVLIGSGPGEPSADEWARACGTINYEIVTRLAPTISRHYHQEDQP